MSIEANKQVVRDFFGYGNVGNMEACLGLLADELSWEVTGNTRFSKVYQPKQVVLDELVGPLFSQLKAGIHMEIDHLVAEGDTVAVLARGTAEKLDGTSYNNRYCHVMKVVDGKIHGVVEYLDTALVDKVFGAS